MIKALSPNYKVNLFNTDSDLLTVLNNTDIVAFPGGIGDADSYDKFFRRKRANMIADFVESKGYYLGICMGAYWAGSHYFDILNDIEPVQYIKRPNADIRRSYSTVANVTWNGKPETMFFYDGCALTGNLERAKIVSTYANGDAMAIIQNRVGVIGCHPESQKYWYEKPRAYISEHWHEERTHKLLLDFVNELTENANIHISEIKEEKSSRKEDGRVSKVERFLADNFIL
jgi:glutamine amidotransferase-like uncharacterized protein